MIVMGKYYITRDMREVRILCVDNLDGGDFPVVGIISDNCGNVTTWRADGTGGSGDSNHTDLLEVTESPKKIVRNKASLKLKALEYMVNKATEYFRTEGCNQLFESEKDDAPFVKVGFISNREIAKLAMDAVIELGGGP